MEPSTIALIVVAAVIVIIVIWLIATYNKLVGLKARVANAWAQIEVHLKRRFDLIPNLVSTVKGYASHEQETLGAVTEARTKYLAANTPNEKMAASGELSEALSRLMAVSEAYPDLKANANFLDLQNELTDTEDKIAFARQFYNDTVMKYNIKLQQFPTVLVAGMFRFAPADSFKAEEADRTAPKVEF